MSTNVEHIIEKGPGSYAEGGVDLDVYLQSLNRLAKAQKYFEKHIPQSVELENVVRIVYIFAQLPLIKKKKKTFQSALFNKGSDKLNIRFKNILDKHNKPMLPVVLLNLINNDEGCFFFHKKQLKIYKQFCYRHIE